MTDMLSRNDTSSAVLIGCHRFTDLEDLLAVQKNLVGLSEALTDPMIWGLEKDRLKVLDQPCSGDDVLDAVAKAADAAHDTLVVYYSGHGLIDPSTGELYMALPDSRIRNVLVQRALRYDYLRRIVSSSGARKKVMLLDCCFSGRALGAMASADHSAAANVTMVDGTCVITSASATALSLAVPGEKYTAFTGVLLDILQQGVPGAGTYLTMETVFDAARSRLAARSLPLPQQRNRNTAGRICIARNRASAPSSSPGEQAAPPPRDRKGSLETSHVRIYAASGDILCSGLLVSDGIVCTCMHALGTAFDVQITDDEVSSAPIELDFPLLPGVPRSRARVVSWRHDGSDVALLRIEAPVAGSVPAPPTKSRRVRETKFRALGFPRLSDDGIWVSGELRAKPGAELAQAKTAPQSPRMDQGFIGSPIWDETYGGVAGIVMVTQHDGSLAFVLPTSSLSEELNRLARKTRRAERAAWAEQARSGRRERSKARAAQLLSEAASLCSNISAPDTQMQQLTSIIATAVSVDTDVARQLCAVLEQHSTLLQDRLSQVRALSRVADHFAPADGRQAALIAERAEALAREGHGLRMQKRHRLALYAVASGFSRIDPRRAESILTELGPAQNDDDISAVSAVLRSIAAIDPDRAERGTRSLPRSYRLRAEQVLSAVAIAVARQQPDRAQELANSISDPNTRMYALMRISASLALSDPDRAERLALGLADQGFQSSLLTTLADSLASRDPYRAERIAHAIPHAALRARALDSVFEKMIRHDPQRAEHMARTFLDPDKRAQALHALVSRLASTDADRAEAIARSFGDDEDIAEALLRVVDRLRETAPDAAARIALSMPASEPGPRARALALTAQELVWHSPDHARQLFQEAEQSARVTPHVMKRHLAYSACAAGLAETDPERARQITQKIKGRGDRALAWCDMVTALAGTAPALQAELLAAALRKARKLTYWEHKTVLRHTAARLIHTPLSRRKVRAFAEQITEQAMGLLPSPYGDDGLQRLADQLVEVDRHSAAELALEVLRTDGKQHSGDRYGIHSLDALMILALTKPWHLTDLAPPRQGPSNTDERDKFWRDLIKAMTEKARILTTDADTEDPADALPLLSDG
ncbi:caspase family protein [Streptomyces koyangensis]|uniref:Peptidase C14 caspase domain-containing protein n=1 Tax=Streptomyces koyangensis TaxID=188770 RepID=A0A385DLH1_9ACTN|nr:caspase family protein [Streptomyces koyangensis]AXQ58754.1 hypothetical protein D0C37_31875 [Streptomyces koyangensis]